MVLVVVVVVVLSNLYPFWIRSKTLAAQEQLRLLVADAPVGTYRDHFYVLRHLNGEKITMEEMNQVMRSFSMEAIQIAHEIPLKDRVASTLSTQREPVLEIPFDPSQAGISLFSGGKVAILEREFLVCVVRLRSLIV